jgi:GTP-binding protein HflX
VNWDILTSKYQRRYIDQNTTVLFIDTIGFVLGLDPRLIKSFQLNMLDMLCSDLVILLLEINDPQLHLQMKLVEGIRLLKEIGIPREKIIIAFNKLDEAPELETSIENMLELERFEIPWISISAKKKTNINELLELISQRLKKSTLILQTKMNY